MSFSEILGRIWQILRGRAQLFLLIGGVPAAAVQLVEAAVWGVAFATGQFPLTPHGAPAPVPNPRFIVIAMVAGCAIWPLFIPVYGWFHAAATHAAFRVNDGQPVTAREALGAAWRKIGRYCLLILLQWLYIGLPAMVFVLLVSGCFALASAAGHENAGAWFFLAPLIVLFYVGFLFYGIWMGLRLGLAYPASVAEDLPAMAAIQRSAQLTRNAKGRMFAVLLIVYAIGYAVMFVVEMVVFALVFGGTLLFMFLHLQTQPVWVGIGIGLAGALVAALFFVYIAALFAAIAVSFAVMYGDQRRRIEGTAAGALETQLA